MSLKYVNILLISLLVIHTSIKQLDSSSLKLVQIVQRHGDRTPTNFYANDQYKDPSYWTDGIGQLTLKGKARMYEFGRTIRLKYANYLGESPREVYARSSASTRCLESAQCFMAALYPPVGYWVWSNDTSSNASVFANYWQPIAIDTVQSSRDSVLVTTATCPAADSVWREMMQSEEVRDYLNPKKHFIEQLSKYTGDEYWSAVPSTLRPLEFLSTTLRVEREHGLEMPDWANNQLLEELRDLELHAFYFDWKDPRIHRLRAGSILKELSQAMNDTASNGTEIKRLYVYETHDVLLVVLMQALGVYDQLNRTPPTYSASLVFELHEEIGQQFAVKLFYYPNTGETLDYSVELNLTKCVDNGYSCTLDKFLSSIKSVIPDDWERECGLLGDSSSGSFSLIALSYQSLGIVFGLALVVLLLV